MQVANVIQKESETPCVLLNAEPCLLYLAEGSQSLDVKSNYVGLGSIVMESPASCSEKRAVQQQSGLPALLISKVRDSATTQEVFSYRTEGVDEHSFF